MHNRPHWVDSKTVTNCTICNVQFSLITRKHHCRSCGRVFCWKCSSRFVPLPHYGYTTPQRTCDICYKDATLQDDIDGELANDDLIKRWLVISIRPEYQDELRDRIFNGIPNALRPMVWTSLAAVPELISKNKGLYTNEEIDANLQWDIPRTFPSHPMFQDGAEGQRMLFNVLRAYANLKPYYQSMSYIVAVLLMYLEEESTFWTFTQMMKHYKLEMLLNQQAPPCIKQYSSLVASVLPHLHRHFEKEGFAIEIFVSQWLQTAFAHHFETKVVVRLWDVFFVEGISFFLKVPLALMHQYCDRLLAMNSSELIFFFKSLPQLVVEPNALITRARALIIPDSSILRSLLR